MKTLGNRYKDVVSGFEGVATGRVEYLYGNARIMLEATKLKKEGECFKGIWFDEDSLTLVEGETK